MPTTYLITNVKLHSLFLIVLLCLTEVGAIVVVSSQSSAFNNNIRNNENNIMKKK